MKEDYTELPNRFETGFMGDTVDRISDISGGVLFHRTYKDKRGTRHVTSSRQIPEGAREDGPFYEVGDVVYTDPDGNKYIHTHRYGAIQQKGIPVSPLPKRK
jgi:hypothetical protein